MTPGWRVMAHAVTTSRPPDQNLACTQASSTKRIAGYGGSSRVLPPNFEQLRISLLAPLRVEWLGDRRFVSIHESGQTRA